MYKNACLASLLLASSTVLAAAPAAASAAAPSEAAVSAAKYAVATYRNDVVDTLAKLVSFNTVADPRYPSDQNPVHAAFKATLKAEAERMGLDYTDYGWTVVIGLAREQSASASSPMAMCSQWTRPSGRSRRSCWTARASRAS